MAYVCNTWWSNFCLQFKVFSSTRGRTWGYHGRVFIRKKWYAIGFLIFWKQFINWERKLHKFCLSRFCPANSRFRAKYNKKVERRINFFCILRLFAGQNLKRQNLSNFGWQLINCFQNIKKEVAYHFFSSKNPTVITPRTPPGVTKNLKLKANFLKYYNKRMPNFNKIP